MTWPWPICFSLLAALPAAAAAVSGQVELADSREASVRRGKDYSGVAVWLEPVGRKLPLPPSRTYTMLQKGKKFIPHVLVIPAGAVVDFPNADPIFHNAFSNFSGQQFDTGLYAPGSTQKVQFRREGAVRVFCNIHSNMSAVIVVVNTPYFARTGRNGAFRIENVEPGEYTVRVWHERAPEGRLAELERRIAVRSDATLPLMRISESGYLEVPHKNKHGKDYPENPAEHILYPGIRK